MLVGLNRAKSWSLEVEETSPDDVGGPFVDGFASVGVEIWLLKYPTLFQINRYQ